MRAETEDESQSKQKTQRRDHVVKTKFLIVDQWRAPGVTRTPDRRIRNPLLYPAELRARIIGKIA